MDRSIGLSSAPAEMAGLYQAGPVGSGPVEPVVERPARSAAWSSRPGWVDSMRVGVASRDRGAGPVGASATLAVAPTTRTGGFRLDGRT